MNKNLIVLGELHQDLYYETDFYEQLANEVVNRVSNFIRFNPDDMTKKMLEKVVKKAINDSPKKVMGKCYFKRGGNGNNSAEFIAKLGILTKLISVIGRGSEWMIPELKELGINTDAIFQIDEITPVSTIIKSKFTNKIYLAPNLKDKMNFNGVSINDNVFDNAKFIFSTPVAEKFIKLFNKGYELGLITAFNIETQKIQTMEQMNQLIKERYDILFLNVKDATIILKKDLPIEEIDKRFKQFAKIRVYTASKEGSHIYTDNFKLFFPGVEVKDVIDRTGAGDCYAAGFLTILFESIEDKKQLDELLKKENIDKLKSILSSCGQFATYSAIYKITKQTPPTRKELEEFIKTFKK